MNIEQIFISFWGGKIEYRANIYPWLIVLISHSNQPVTFFCVVGVKPFIVSFILGVVRLPAAVLAAAFVDKVRKVSVYLEGEMFCLLSSKLFKTKCLSIDGSLEPQNTRLFLC